MGNKPSNTTGGGTSVEKRQTSSRRAAGRTLPKPSNVGGGAPVVPLGPKNYVDMGFPEEDPSTGEVKRKDGVG